MTAAEVVSFPKPAGSPRPRHRGSMAEWLTAPDESTGGEHVRTKLLSMAFVLSLLFAPQLPTTRTSGTELSSPTTEINR